MLLLSMLHYDAIAVIVAFVDVVAVVGTAIAIGVVDAGFYCYRC